MTRHWFIIAVSGLWLTSMSWLFFEKLWPIMQAGPPPNNLTAYGQTQQSNGEVVPIGWDLSWGELPIGWAVTTSRINSEGYTYVQSHAHLENIPLEELVPILFRGYFRSATNHQKQISLDTDSRLVFDPTGAIVRLAFLISHPEHNEPIRIVGEVESKALKITLHSGQRTKLSTFSLPANAVLGNDLSPLVRLPDLYQGQIWNVPICSPFRTGSNVNLEYLQARVERKETLTVNDVQVPVWLVVLRRDPSAILAANRIPRAKIWVSMDGTVLQQESYLNNIRLKFTRSSAAKAQEYWAKSKQLQFNQTVDPLELIPDSQPGEELQLQPLLKAFSEPGKSWIQIIPRLLPQETEPGSHDPFEQFDRPEPPLNWSDADELFQGSKR